MKLGEFIKNFSHNNMIRLHYEDKKGTILVLENWNDVSMDWEVNKCKGVYRHYINNEVLKLISILILPEHSHYPEAINIVIENLGDNQPYLDEMIENEITTCDTNN